MGAWRGRYARPRAFRSAAAGLAAAVALLASAPGGLAQGRDGGGSRWVVGGGLALSVPQGELAEFIDHGLGFGGHVRYGLDRAGLLSLRLDASAVTYGSETFRVPLSQTVSRVLVDVTTRNSILLVGFGPQLTLPAGAVRPYVNGAVGLGYFFTESSVRGSGNLRFDDFARTTNFDDLSFAYGAGGGMAVALDRRRRLFLVLDGQYRDHGRTRYLREGSVREDGSGRLTIAPLESDANLLLFQLGLAVRL